MGCSFYIQNIVLNPDKTFVVVGMKEAGNSQQKFLDTYLSNPNIYTVSGNHILKSQQQGGNRFRRYYPISLGWKLMEWEHSNK